MRTSLLRIASWSLSLLAAGCAASPAPVTPTAGALAREPSWIDAGPAAQAGQSGDTEALAKQLANPVASLISVPLQYNYDQDIGPADGTRSLLNIQPVVPISLNEDWNLISRTIVPVVDVHDVPPGNDEFGFGDVLQSAFFSPVEPTASGWIWGVGPVLLLPTATDETLGGEKWGIGPTAVVLRQSGPWTYGALANHIWSFAGDDDRADISSTFMQPFLVYTTPTATTCSLNLEATYDWERHDLAVPVNAMVSQVLKLGSQLVSVGGGLRYWIEDTDASPEGLGFRVVLTLLYPR